MEAVTGNVDRTLSLLIITGASKVAQCKESPSSAGDARDRGSIPGLGRFSGGGNGNPAPAFLPGESQGRKSQVGLSPWGRAELDTAE